MIMRFWGFLTQVIPLLFIVSLIAFAITDLLPGDAAIELVGLEATKAQLELAREKLGLNDPMPVRYLSWLTSALTGDLGQSLRSGEEVLNVLIRRVSVTVELAFLGTLFAVVIGVPAGIVSAKFRGSWFDGIINFISLSGMAVPYFWLGLLLIMLFSLNLQWVPPSGYISFSEDPLQHLKLMVLPTLTVAIAFAATMMRQTRASMLEVLTADYIRTARAKGLSERKILLKHGLRNALVPVITIMGLQMGTLMGGAIITESVFALPGLGTMIVEGIFRRDTPIIQGALVMTVLLVVLTNLATDALYRLANPRIK